MTIFIFIFILILIIFGLIGILAKLSIRANNRKIKDSIKEIINKTGWSNNCKYSPEEALDKIEELIKY